MAHVIVVIEDDTLLREAVVDLLRANGFVVHEAASGSAGIAQVKRHITDCLITDLTLPDMDGIAVIQQLRADADSYAIPIIVLSGVVDANQRAAALKTGANSYLSKPFDIVTLIATIQRVILTRSSDE